MSWEVRGLNIYNEPAVLSHGESEESFPDVEMREALRAAGHKIYVDAKVYKEPEVETKKGRKKKVTA